MDNHQRFFNFLADFTFFEPKYLSISSSPSSPPFLLFLPPVSFIFYKGQPIELNQTD